MTATPSSPSELAAAIEPRPNFARTLSIAWLASDQRAALDAVSSSPATSVSSSC
jgi:hypothetical protein